MSYIDKILLIGIESRSQWKKNKNAYSPVTFICSFFSGVLPVIIQPMLNTVLVLSAFILQFPHGNLCDFKRGFIHSPESFRDCLNSIPVCLAASQHFPICSSSSFFFFAASILISSIFHLEMCVASQRLFLYAVGTASNTLIVQRL